MTDTIEDLDRKIAEASKTIQSLNASVRRWADRRDDLLIDRNKGHFGDIEWLINNPNTPGQYEAMKAWITARFGGEWEGVHPSGYYPKISQQAFSITLFDRWRDEDEKDAVSHKVENVKAFLAECLQFMKPNDDGFVSFTYTTGQHSGIFGLAYRPSDKTWWTTNTRYSRMVRKDQHADLDTAIAAAQAIAARIDD